MKKEKYLAEFLFGKSFETKLSASPGRSWNFNIPRCEETGRDRIDRSLTIRGDDGLFVYLIKRIEQLELDIIELKINNKK